MSTSICESSCGCGVAAGSVFFVVLVWGVRWGPEQQQCASPARREPDFTPLLVRNRRPTQYPCHPSLTPPNSSPVLCVFPPPVKACVPVLLAPCHLLTGGGGLVWLRSHHPMHWW